MRNTGKTVRKQSVVDAALKIEEALLSQGRGLKAGRLASRLNISQTVLYNAIAFSMHICEDDDGRLYYIDWKKTPDARHC